MLMQQMELEKNFNLNSLLQTDHPDVKCTKLPDFWRIKKSLHEKFRVYILNDLCRDGTKVTIHAGNKKYPIAELKNNEAIVHNNVAEFTDLRFISTSGRDTKFNVFIMFETRPIITVSYMNAIKVTVDGPRPKRIHNKSKSQENGVNNNDNETTITTTTTAAAVPVKLPRKRKISERNINNNNNDNDNDNENIPLNCYIEKSFLNSKDLNNNIKRNLTLSATSNEIINNYGSGSGSSFRVFAPKRISLDNDNLMSDCPIPHPYLLSSPTLSSTLHDNSNHSPILSTTPKSFISTRSSSNSVIDPIENAVFIQQQQQQQQECDCYQCNNNTYLINNDIIQQHYPHYPHHHHHYEEQFIVENPRFIPSNIYGNYLAIQNNHNNCNNHHHHPPHYSQFPSNPSAYYFIPQLSHSNVGYYVLAQNLNEINY